MSCHTTQRRLTFLSILIFAVLLVPMAASATMMDSQTNNPTSSVWKIESPAVTRYNGKLTHTGNLFETSNYFRHPSATAEIALGYGQGPIGPILCGIFHICGGHGHGHHNGGGQGDNPGNSGGTDPGQGSADVPEPQYMGLGVGFLALLTMGGMSRRRKRRH